MKEQLERRISELRELEHGIDKEVNYLRSKTIEKEKELISIKGGIIELNILLKKFVDGEVLPGEAVEDPPVEPAKP